MIGNLSALTFTHSVRQWQLPLLVLHLTCKQDYQAPDAACNIDHEHGSLVPILIRFLWLWWAVEALTVTGATSRARILELETASYDRADSASICGGAHQYCQVAMFQDKPSRPSTTCPSDSETWQFQMRSAKLCPSRCVNMLESESTLRNIQVSRQVHQNSEHHNKLCTAKAALLRSQVWHWKPLSSWQQTRKTLHPCKAQHHVLEWTPAVLPSFCNMLTPRTSWEIQRHNP